MRGSFSVTLGQRAMLGSLGTSESMCSHVRPEFSSPFPSARSFDSGYMVTFVILGGGRGGKKCVLAAFKQGVSSIRPHLRNMRAPAFLLPWPHDFWCLYEFYKVRVALQPLACKPLISTIVPFCLCVHIDSFLTLVILLWILELILVHPGVSWISVSSSYSRNGSRTLYSPSAFVSEDVCPLPL